MSKVAKFDYRAALCGLIDAAPCKQEAKLFSFPKSEDVDDLVGMIEAKYAGLHVIGYPATHGPGGFIAVGPSEREVERLRDKHLKAVETGDALDVVFGLLKI